MSHNCQCEPSFDKLRTGSRAKKSPPICHCEPCKGEAISSLAHDVTPESPKPFDQPEICFLIGSQ
jgi:hypothetical protein